MTTRSPSQSAEPSLGLSIEDLYRLTVDQYHAIAEAGILTEDDPVELLEGWLVCKYGPFEAPSSWLPAPSENPASDDEDGLTLAWIWRFTTDQYHGLIDAGVLAEGEPVELLGGWLVHKMTQRPPHPIAIDLLREALAHPLSGNWYLRTQAPIRVSDGEPEPDLAVARGHCRDYRQRHPGATDITLVIEVADTSLARDRGVKKQIYARAGIPVYWIVNLIDRQIEVYTDPTGPADEPDYRKRRDFGADERVPVVLDGVEVGTLPVADLLP